LAISGNAGRWAARFPDYLVPVILKLVLRCWARFSTQQQYEVPITRQFHAVLVQDQERSWLPFLIDYELPLSVEGGAEELGRLDLRITAGYRHGVYFSLECKRLRVTRPSGRFQSLEEGMYRYFSGQYATGLDKAGMLGYVMDGDVGAAIKDVAAAIGTRKRELHMADAEPLRPSSLLPSKKQVRETRHQYGPDGKFLIHHVFLPMS